MNLRTRIQHIKSFMEIACCSAVVKRATTISLLVGVILATINHGDRLLTGDIDGTVILKILLTFCVPYLVSTYSSVLAIRELQRR